MTDAEGVVLALGARRKWRQAPRLLDGMQAVAPPREYLVRVGLMAHIPDQPVVRRVEHKMEGDRQLHRPQARGEMAATGADGMDQELAQLLRHRRQFRNSQAAEVRG